jgi:hypothetical protein
VSYRSTGLAYQAGGTDGPFVVKAHDEYALELVTSILRGARSLPGRAVSELAARARTPALAHEITVLRCAADGVPD